MTTYADTTTDLLETMNLSELLRLVPYGREKKSLEDRFWQEVRAAARIVTVELSPRRTAFVQIGGGCAVSFETLPVLRGDILRITTSASERTRYMEDLASEPSRRWVGSPGLRADVIAEILSHRQAPR